MPQSNKKSNDAEKEFGEIDETDRDKIAGYVLIGILSLLVIVCLIGIFTNKK